MIFGTKYHVSDVNQTKWEDVARHTEDESCPAKGRCWKHSTETKPSHKQQYRENYQHNSNNLCDQAFLQLKSRLSLRFFR